MARYTKTGTFTSIEAIDAQLTLISKAIDDTLSRKRDVPNQMEGPLDINNNRVINAAKPFLPSDVATKAYVDSLAIVGTVPLSKSKDLVIDYGAKGDATYTYNADGSMSVIGTDDTQALLNAMADFASGGLRSLTVPQGNFFIDSSQIDTPTGTTIIGEGSAATKFLFSTTNPNLNLFVGFYQGARVSNLHFEGIGFVGSKVDNNSVGGTCIFTFGTEGVTGSDLACEGSKGLLWLGNDNVEGLRLFGTSDVFLSDLRVKDCKLFSVYVRGNENPNAAALAVNDIMRDLR